MILLVRIAELVFLYVIARSFIRVLLPAKRNNAPTEKKAASAPRFDGKECDISDADYEEVE
ncbi:MAG: hypothetical protein JW863_10675 [Chitinispirillaceae bacterium]|nr:hypothetical protein [Chitinispirillaceae bacterium]